jgi:CBS domain containing-hemolysin-like protein
MSLLIFFFVLSIVFSFLCSVWEAVLLSITPSYVRRKVKEGGTIGKRLDAYKEDIDRPLSAILTLNTIAHTVGAIGVGAQAGHVFGETPVSFFGLFEISAESVIATVMTLAILILSEIIPKTIGANNWQTLAPFTVRSLGVLLWILKPLVWISQFITKRLKNDKNKSVLSRADFAAMAKVGAEFGTLTEKETTIINNLLELEKLTVRDVMTPRTVMIMGEEEMTVKDFYGEHDPLRYSRIPIYKEKSDNITGLVLKDDILEQLADDHDELQLKDLKRRILIVDDDQNLFSLFETLTRQRSHLAIAVDNYGSLVGLITLEDVIETLFGLEIMDESDRVADLQQHAQKMWEKRSQELEQEEDKNKKVDKG